MGPSGQPATPAAFIAKWTHVELSERAASHEHYLDLCRLLGQPTPAEHDATGTEYAFEKGVAVSDVASKGSAGDRGFADVWWKGKFAWEYKRKGKYKTLDDAYRQLQQYREALDNPPLLIVSDIARTEIHTNFTGTRKEIHTIALANLDKPASLDLLRRVFDDPDSFKPQITTEKITQDVAGGFAGLAVSLQKRSHDPHAVAHFLMKCMFCLFAEDVQLLPGKLFTRLLERTHTHPEKFKGLATQLFDAMRTGGDFGMEAVPFFNGGLFDDAPPLDLNRSDIGTLSLAAGQDWAAVEPHIFGTLFERSLDPSKRAQIGAHYTSREDILLVVEPVVMKPLRREFDAMRAAVLAQIERKANAAKGAGVERTKKTAKDTIRDANKSIHTLLLAFQHRLSTVKILDPACGSGNFLYVALQQLLDLEKELVTFAARPDIAQGLVPKVRPTQLYGIELNAYASELAQVVIWIGYLQWMRANGFVAPSNPILENLNTIENRDAIVDRSTSQAPVPARWPDADFIIGNPPFLGSKLFRASGLPDDYIQALYDSYSDAKGNPILPRTSDLCCYWFELARRKIEKSKAVRAGLLATQGIRGGDNRRVLERIKENAEIFMAWSDREWVLDGAMVHVSIVGFGGDPERGEHELDGGLVASINTDLSSGHDLTSRRTLLENGGIGFMGDTKGGAFNLEYKEARELIGAPNPHGRSNCLILAPWMNGSDITKRNRAAFIVDFGCSMSQEDASQFERPFAVVADRVKPHRIKNRRATYAERWWIHVEPRPAMRRVLPKRRFLVTPNVTKHRLFTWVDGWVLPDHQLIAFARSDDYLFGVLHSAVHELWSRAMGTQLREVESGFRYTPTTCFDTFPLPWAPGDEPAAEGAPPSQSTLYTAVSSAAKELNDLRERWLNPPELIAPIAKQVDAVDDFADVPVESRAMIRQSAISAAAAKHPELKKRTLTNLYNARPTWLQLAHQKLDRAVLAAYAAVDPDGRWDPEWADLYLPSGAGQTLPTEHPDAAKRRAADAAILANLLRLNHARAG